MNRDALTRLSTDDLIALVEAQAETIARLTAQLEALTGQNAALGRRVAELGAKLDLPSKIPDNSSTSPSQGRKANDAASAKPKSKPHAGAHRPLHPNPTHKHDVMASHCQHCGKDVSDQPQVACESRRRQRA